MLQLTGYAATTWQKASARLRCTQQILTGPQDLPLLFLIHFLKIKLSHRININNKAEAFIKLSTVKTLMSRSVGVLLELGICVHTFFIRQP